MSSDGTRGYEEGIEGIDNLIKKLDRIQRRALKAAADAVAPRLIEATPLNPDVPSAKGTSLKPGTLKENVRAYVAKDKKTGKLQAKVDFGDYSWIANAVDGGHKPPYSKLAAKMGKEVTGRNTPAHPFVRRVQDAERANAQKAYTESFDKGIQKALKGKK